MNITILDKSTVKYNGRYLVEFQTYSDMDERTANDLVKQGLAKLAKDEVVGVSVETAPLAPRTAKFDAKANGGYVAEAVIEPEKRAKLEAEGKLNDQTPVSGKDSTQPIDNTPEPSVQTEVLGPDGQPLSEEELRKREAAAQSNSGNEPVSTVNDLQNSGKVV